MADQHQHREEFERRLLALVRDYMDDVDEMNPDGYEIGDFMVIYEVFERIPESKPLEPWSGGVRAGFDSPYIAFSSTTGMYWQDEAWLREALYRVQTRREDRRAEANAQGESESSDEDDT
jgi:hypothetical protein